MIKYYKHVNNHLKEVKKSSGNLWIDLSSPNEKELEELSKLSGIPVDDLKMALDEDERSRIDVSKNFTMVIFRLPFIKDETEIETSPIGIFLTKKYIITIHLFYTGYVKPVFDPSNKIPINSGSEFLLYIMNEIIKSYQKILGRIEKQVDVIEDEVIKSPEDIDIEKIGNIKRTLIYFHRSLIANRVVLIHIVEKNVPFIDKKYNEDFKDINIEILQLLEMTITYKDLLKGSMDSYSSMLSNKLGETVKILTIITAILTIPLLITSMYGMNISLPLGSNEQAFTILLIITAIAMLGTLMVFKIKKWV